MTFKQIYKKIALWVKIVLQGALVLILSWSSYTSLNSAYRPLYQSEYCKGKVIRSYLTNKKTRTAKNIRLTHKVFCFFVENIPDQFTVFSIRENYLQLQKHIVAGQVVEVYYKSSKEDNFNMEVFQIEKNNIIIYSYDQYTQNAKIAGYAALIGAILIGSIQIILTINGLKLYDKIFWLNKFPDCLRKIK